MSFELTIAGKFDPRESIAADVPHVVRPLFTAITLSGEFGPEASREVLLAIRKAWSEAAGSILVEMQDVVSNDPACLAAFAAELMALRGSGVQVQLLVHGVALHEELRQLPQSRDWLVAFSENAAGGARRALHLDGPNAGR